MTAVADRMKTGNPGLPGPYSYSTKQGDYAWPICMTC